jgi:hypothetical protein
MRHLAHAVSLFFEVPTPDSKYEKELRLAGSGFIYKYTKSIVNPQSL